MTLDDVLNTLSDDQLIIVRQEKGNKLLLRFKGERGFQPAMNHYLNSRVLYTKAINNTLVIII